MKYSSWIALGTALIGFLQPAIADIHAPTDVSHAVDMKSARDGLVRGLLARQYFKIASCKDFSNMILEQNGLPKLGQEGSVNGLRPNVDRRYEKKNPPEFADSVQQQDLTQNTYEVTASGDRKNWVLTLNRDVKVPISRGPAARLKTRTDYRFTVVEKANVGSCELMDMGFHAEARGAKSFDKKLGLDSCMNLFMKGKPDWRTTPPASNAAISYLYHDCSIGMHYSAEAKFLASKTH